VAFLRCYRAFHFGDHFPLDLPEQNGEQEQARQQILIFPKELPSS
jgi:hypothetical protein